MKEETRTLRQSRVRVLLVVTTATLLILSLILYGPSVYNLIRKTTTQQLNTGIIVPMYDANYSHSQVDEVIHAKNANPQVPFIVVVNRNNGPGDSFSPEFLNGIRSMQTAGITVLGYVPTGWGERNVSSIEKDISTFYSWYGVNGIYLDQMVNWEFSQSGSFLAPYYSTLTNYTKSLGMTEVLGNSGADIPYYFVGTVDAIGFFENSFAPPLSYLGGWHTSYNKSIFWFCSYNVSSFNPYYLADASDYVGYLFLTDGTRPYPYNSLPTYFDKLVSELGSMVPVHVESAMLNGTPINNGFQVTVTQPDGSSVSEFTPATFNVYSGSRVTISVNDHKGYVFDHWSDGSTNRTRVLSPDQAMTLIAYSRTSVPTQATVIVHSSATDGTPVTGMHTVASTNGSVVASGFTPFSFEANRNTSYSISVSNYENYSFASWHNGSNTTQRTITIKPNQDTYLNAIFNRNGSISSTVSVPLSTNFTSVANSSTNSATSASTILSPLETSWWTLPRLFRLSVASITPLANLIAGNTFLLISKDSRNDRRIHKIFL